MKDALLYIAPAGGAAVEAANRFAAGLAQHFRAEVTGVTFAFDVVPPLRLYAPPTDDGNAQALRAQNRERAAAALNAAAAAFIGTEASFTGATEECLEIQAGDVLVEYARLRDVAILPNERGKAPLERGLIEEVLFGAARPIILVPDHGKAEFKAGRVMVAWDYSRPAARAVADALPILRAAGHAHVVTVTDDKELNPRLGTIELARHLAKHKIEATIHQITRGKRGIGEALLAQAQATDANLLVMGGYGHSRAREFILGGATESLLTEAPLPILMSH
jgi:nucleotide-binding universal stress UspA family protein